MFINKYFCKKDIPIIEANSVTRKAVKKYRWMSTEHELDKWCHLHELVGHEVADCEIEGEMGIVVFI